MSEKLFVIETNDEGVWHDTVWTNDVSARDWHTPMRVTLSIAEAQLQIARELYPAEEYRLREVSGGPQ